MKQNYLAIVLMIVGATLIPLGDAIAKYANEFHGTPVPVLAWSRFALGAVISAPFLIWGGAKLAQMRHPWVLLRGVLIACTVGFILEAASRAPLADAYGAFFLAPLISFVLAVVFLGERAGLQRWLAIIAGFGGVLLVVRPSFEMADGMVLGLIAGVFYGSFLATNRFLSPRFNAASMLQSQMIVAAIVLFPFALPLEWGDGTVAAWILITLSAITSSLANLLMVMAYARAEATKLAPLIYVQILAATSYGVLFFGGWPDPITWMGLAILVISGVAGVWRRKS